MNLLSQTGIITSLNAGESPWNNWFYAHPHPGPLPRGEGETVAASWQKGGVLVHGCNARLFRENHTLPLGENRSQPNSDIRDWIGRTDIRVYKRHHGLFPLPRERVRAVSYTHLRAHETRHDLVCRLLLEKK